MKERFNENLGKELADVAIGAGLIVAGPKLAEEVFNEAQVANGGGVNFLPPNEAVNQVFETSLETAQGLTGIAAVALVMCAGFKRLMPYAFKNKK